MQAVMITVFFFPPNYYSMTQATIGYHYNNLNLYQNTRPLLLKRVVWGDVADRRHPSVA